MLLWIGGKRTGFVRALRLHEQDNGMHRLALGGLLHRSVFGCRDVWFTQPLGCPHHSMRISISLFGHPLELRLIKPTQIVLPRLLVETYALQFGQTLVAKLVGYLSCTVVIWYCIWFSSVKICVQQLSENL